MSTGAVVIGILAAMALAGVVALAIAVRAVTELFNDDWVNDDDLS